MKKYIRTKNNKIYVYVGEEKYSVQSSMMVHRYQELKTGTKCAYGQHILKEENIYKESDDITDLCDEFTYTIHYSSGEIKYVNTDYVAVGSEKGGIWTEEGFIFICKRVDEDTFVPFVK